jgi:hypothetical protein
MRFSSAANSGLSFAHSPEREVTWIRFAAHSSPSQTYGYRLDSLNADLMLTAINQSLETASKNNFSYRRFKSPLPRHPNASAYYQFQC